MNDKSRWVLEFFQRNENWGKWFSKKEVAELTGVPHRSVVSAIEAHKNHGFLVEEIFFNEKKEQIKKVTISEKGKRSIK